MDLRHAGIGWPENAGGEHPDAETILGMPGIKNGCTLICSPSARYWYRQARAASPLVVWRAIPRQGRLPAQLGWEPNKVADECLNLWDEQPHGDGEEWFLPLNELQFEKEAGEPFPGYARMAEHLGQLRVQLRRKLRQQYPKATVQLLFPAWVPTDDVELADAWLSEALLWDGVCLHAYGTANEIRARYEAYRLLLGPDQPILIGEWNGNHADTDERATLAMLAQIAASDQAFLGAAYFIWETRNAGEGDLSIWGNPGREALFRDPPTVQPSPAPPEIPAMPDYRAMTRDAAAAAGIDPALFERQIEAESGYAEDVITCRRVSSAGAQGIAQIVARFHPGVNPCDPPAALAYAATLMAGHLRKYGGDWALGLSAYNAGPGATASGLKDQLAGWPYAETVRYVSIILQIPEAEARLRLSGQKGAPVAARVTFNRDQAAFPQDKPWNCAPTALRWALWAVGRQPSEQWIEDTMLAEGVVSHELGLLDATGAGLAAFVKRQYGDFGYDSNNEPDVSFAAVAAEIGPYPLLVGGRAWDHWSGVRGYDAGRDVLLLANPGDGYQGVGQTLSRDQWDSLGPWSLVRVLHPDLLAPETPAPAPPPAPVPPAPDPKVRAAALLREAIAILEGS